jgi:hypothetical protein
MTFNILMLVALMNIQALPFEPDKTLRSWENNPEKGMDSTGFEPVAFTLQT